MRIPLFPRRRHDRQLLLAQLPQPAVLLHLLQPAVPLHLPHRLPRHLL
jgi:hypothetical protein